MDANTAFKGLIASQLEGLATLIAERFDGVDKQGVLTLVQAHCETLPDMDAAIKSKKPRRRREKAQPVQPAEQCMARVWGKLGDGKEQCGLRRKGDTEYCSRHGKQASITELACQVNEDGKHIGLFNGRIDQPRPWRGVDGTVRIEWKCPEHKAEVAQAIADGTAHRHPDARRRRRKTKKAKAPTTPSTMEEPVALVLASSTPDDDEGVEEDALASLAAITIPNNGTSAKPTGPSHEEDGEVADTQHFQQQQADDDEHDLDDLFSDDEEDPEQDTLKVVEKKDHAGKTWLVDPISCCTYDAETHEEVGEWETILAQSAPKQKAQLVIEPVVGSLMDA